MMVVVFVALSAVFSWTLSFPFASRAQLMASKCLIVAWICAGDEGVKGTGMIFLVISSISPSSRTSSQSTMGSMGSVVPNWMLVALGDGSAFGLMYWRREEMELVGEAGHVEEIEGKVSDMDESEVTLL
jgi:hypothetical protein